MAAIKAPTRRWRLNSFSNFQRNGNFTFNGQVTGNALADFMLGKPSSFTQNNGQIGDGRLTVPSLYAQDNFRLSSRPTVNAGLRWDPYTAPSKAVPQVSIFDLGWYNAGIHSTLFTNAPIGTLFVGASGMPWSHFFNGRLAEFAPRLGIVYDPRGKGLETIRVGYGIFYGSTPLWSLYEWRRSRTVLGEARGAIPRGYLTMNRRFFLFTAGSAALSAQALPSRQLVVGLIGAGFRGLQLLQQCLSLPSIRIGAVCETFEPLMFGAVALTRSKGHTTRAYRMYGDLIADSDLDAVLIATPDFSHHLLTLDALGAGKHVYVEQPLCLTWQEGVELLNAEKGSRNIIQVGSQRRSSPFFLEASHEGGAGRIGESRIVQADRTSSYLRSGVLRRGPVKFRDPLNFPDWQATPASKVPYSPDRFFELEILLNVRRRTSVRFRCAHFGWHALDDWRRFSCYGHGQRCTFEGRGLDTVDRAAILVEYSNGLLISLTIDGAAAARHELSVIDGANGRIGIEPQEMHGRYNAAQPRLGSPRRDSQTFGKLLPVSAE